MARERPGRKQEHASKAVEKKSLSQLALARQDSA